MCRVCWRYLVTAPVWTKVKYLCFADLIFFHCSELFATVMRWGVFWRTMGKAKDPTGKTPERFPSFAVCGLKMG